MFVHDHTLFKVAIPLPILIWVMLLKNLKSQVLKRQIRAQDQT